MFVMAEEFVDRADFLGNAVTARHMIGHLRAVELEQLADYARATEGDEFAYLEVSTLLHISDRAARRRLSFARNLTQRLPRTLATLKQGHIEEFKAQLIAEAVEMLTAEQAAEVEVRVLDKAAQQTPGQLRNALAKAVLAVDPEGAEERRKERKRDRRVESQPLPDGQGELRITDSIDRITAMHGAIRAQALNLKSLGGEIRTLQQLEADVAYEMIIGSGGERRTVEVHLTLPPTGPAEIDGVGPITREAAVELAAEATRWRWLRADPVTGEVVDVTSPSYSPPAGLAEFIKIRDRTCRFPGCTHPARQSEIDHTIPWPSGATCAANCGSLCKRHHRAKHEGGWQLTQVKPGLFRWISPLGNIHTVTPDPVTDPAPPDQISPVELDPPPY